MKFYFTFLLLLTLPCSLLADTRFNDVFDTSESRYNQIADRVTTYHAEDINLSPGEIKIELEALNQNIEAFLKGDKNNAILWFLKGLNHSNLAAHYARSKNLAASNQQLKQKDSAYEKAMSVDQQTPARLSAAIYATMKHGLPENSKIKAIQKELELGGNGDNESYYWHLHWSNVSALERAGRFDEAQQALENMKREMKQQNVTNPDYQDIVNRAQANVDQARKNSSSIQQPQKTEKTAAPGDEEPESKYQLIWAIGLLAVLAILIVTVYEIVIRKK